MDAVSGFVEPAGEHSFRIGWKGACGELIMYLIPTMCWGVCVYRCVHMHVLVGTCVCMFESVFEYV